jgi:hypothetical protein
LWRFGNTIVSAIAPSPTPAVFVIRVAATIWRRQVVLIRNPAVGVGATVYTNAGLEERIIYLVVILTGNRLDRWELATVTHAAIEIPGAWIITIAI